MILLITSLEEFWKDRDDFFVGGNMFVYYSEVQTKKNDFRGPDVFVVLDTEKKERKSWVVWEENGRTPDVVIELISSSTEATDRGEKMQIYASILQVAEYYLFDPFTSRIEGDELDPLSRTYRPMSPDEYGWFSCNSLGLRLGVFRGRYSGLEVDWLRWIDGEGNIVLLAEEAEAQRADAEAKAKVEAEQRVKTESQRADAEAKAKTEAFKEVERLQKELKKLRS